MHQSNTTTPTLINHPGKQTNHRRQHAVAQATGPAKINPTPPNSHPSLKSHLADPTESPDKENDGSLVRSGSNRSFCGRLARTLSRRLSRRDRNKNANGEPGQIVEHFSYDHLCGLSPEPVPEQASPPSTGFSLPIFDPEPALDPEIIFNPDANVDLGSTLDPGADGLPPTPPPSAPVAHLVETSRTPYTAQTTLTTPSTPTRPEKRRTYVQFLDDPLSMSSPSWPSQSSPSLAGPSLASPPAFASPPKTPAKNYSQGQLGSPLGGSARQPTPSLPYTRSSESPSPAPSPPRAPTRTLPSSPSRPSPSRLHSRPRPVARSRGAPPTPVPSIPAPAPLSPPSDRAIDRAKGASAEPSQQQPLPEPSSRFAQSHLDASHALKPTDSASHEVVMMRHLRLNQGYDCAQQGEFRKALKLYEAAAEMGEFFAVHNIGVMYLYGQGVVHNYAVARNCFVRGAFYTIPASMCQLGYMYLYGCGQEKDYGKARSWLLRAATYNHSFAMFYLAIIYAKGLGVTRDTRIASEWLAYSAARGLPDAQFNLGAMYYMGLGLPQDFDMAAKLFKKAAASGYPEAFANLAVMYANGVGVRQSFTKAVSLTRQAASKNVSQAYFNLGEAYTHGQGVRRNVQKAERMYHAAASKGNVEAKRTLALSQLREKMKLPPKQVASPTSASTLNVNDPYYAAIVNFQTDISVSTDSI